VPTAAAARRSRAGLLGVVVAGTVVHGSLRAGAQLLTLPDGPSLVAFAAAPLASGLITLVWTALLPAPRGAPQH
jgi:hypothetical protein